MTKDLQSNEDRGWIGVKNKETGGALAAALKARKAKTVLAVKNDTDSSAIAADIRITEYGNTTGVEGARCKAQLTHSGDGVQGARQLVPGPSKVWELAQDFWKNKNPNWPPLSLGSLLGCGLAVFRSEKKKAVNSTARLYRILITESVPNMEDEVRDSHRTW
ncbi:hypothetical protein C8R45DRAFT_935335 [Mycena sanguinolenta]|nr:hypothetical protein C8R45DRAFT_935335 [Mycena sanguinolenta]